MFQLYHFPRSPPHDGHFNPQPSENPNIGPIAPKTVHSFAEIHLSLKPYEPLPLPSSCFPSPEKVVAPAKSQLCKSTFRDITREIKSYVVQRLQPIAVISPIDSQTSTTRSRLKNPLHQNNPASRRFRNNT